MELINNLMLGFGVAFTLQNLFYAFFGALLGTLIGVLPGLGPVATIAMLLPSIYALDATPALIMLAGIYYGAQYGGSTTAILINLPGEATAVATTPVATSHRGHRSVVAVVETVDMRVGHRRMEWQAAGIVAAGTARMPTTTALESS